MSRTKQDLDIHKAHVMERCYNLMRDALLVINANGDQISASTARRTLDRVGTELRRSNI